MLIASRRPRRCGAAGRGVVSGAERRQGRAACGLVIVMPNQVSGSGKPRTEVFVHWSNVQLASSTAHTMKLNIILLIIKISW